MRDKPVEELTHEGLSVKIYQDEDATSPDDWRDDNAFLVHYHRDCWIENKRVLTEGDLRDIYQKNDTESVRELRRKYHIWPVTALIHSGVWLRLGHTNFAEDSGGWDTSHVGAVFLSKTEWKTRSKKAIAYAEGLVSAWNQYLSGDVYGFVVEDKDGKHLDSCWGFYGHKYAIEEGMSQAKWHAEEFRKKKQAKVKAMVRAHVALDKRQEVLA